MNEVINKDYINIENLIYEVRGVQVMLDSDLAKLYGCVNGTKTINQAVKRNVDKFPDDFYFQLTKNEFFNLKSQFGTSSWNDYGGIRKLPYVFTEQGVAMLATIIKTKVATEMSITIMRAFVSMRKYISSNLIEQKYINNFDGQIYDAYSKIQEIFKEAKKEIIIIDGYADNTILDIIKRLKVNVTIITKPNNLLTKQDALKYNKQYHNLKVIYDNSFHDRYFILDGNIVYHCGASINRIGYKTFSITLIGDGEVCMLLLNKVNKII